MERDQGKKRVGRSGQGAPLKARPKYLDEVVFDPERGMLSAPNGDDIVLMNGATLRVVLDGMRQMLQSGSDLMWYNAGVHTGKAEGHRLQKAIATMGPDGFLHLINDLYTNLGWGKTTSHGLDTDRMSVVIETRSNPLTRNVRSRQPVCHYIKGFYAGFCAVVFKSDKVTVSEALCEATGADHCEFRIKW